MHRCILVFAEDRESAEEMLNFYLDRQFDWCQFGGRYTGLLDPDYLPHQDPDNMEKCRHCGGEGYHEDSGEQCRYCGGKGESLTWPTSWKEHPGDSVLVKDIDWNKDDDVPGFGFLYDWEWVERPWFTSDDTDNLAHASALRAAVSEMPDDMMVFVVDCHD